MQVFFVLNLHKKRRVPYYCDPPLFQRLAIFLQVCVTPEFFLVITFLSLALFFP